MENTDGTSNIEIIKRNVIDGCDFVRRMIFLDASAWNRLENLLHEYLISAKWNWEKSNKCMARMNDSFVISLKFRQYLEDKILENYILNESSQSYLYSNIPQKFFKIRFASWNSPYGATPQFFTLIIPQLFQARSVYQNETKTSLVAQRCCAAPSWKRNTRIVFN